MRTPRHALLLLVLAAACDGAPDQEGAPLPAGALEVTGFETPESVVYDSVADVYLVSNINGGGRDRDDNGFISRVSPSGTVLDLKWIDGANDGVTLHSPKGSAIVGDSLFVADLDSIRVFDRNTGAPVRAFTVPGATSLNDLAATADGALWVSDMGDGSAEAAARTGLSRIAPDGSVTLVATGAQIDGPNGVVAHGDGVAVAARRSNTVTHAGSAGPGNVVAQVPASQLDGLLVLPDGSMLVSSWEAQAVFRVAPDGTTSVAFDGLRAPADIGYDTRRGRLLVPSFEGGWLRILPLE